MQQKRVIAALAVGIVIWGWLPTGVAHPIVGSLERLGSQVPTEQFGQALMNELQCRNCHNPQADSELQKTAPILTNVGSRIKADYFRAFVTAPHQVKPGTTMPSVFHDMDPKQAEQEATAIWQFLKSKSLDPPAVAYARIGSKERGQLLYESVGCLACHDSKAAEAQPLADSVPHGNLMAKYTLPTLTEFLRDPHAVRTSGRMPNLNLSTNEAADIASYLLAEVPEQAGIAVKLYQGSWQALPDFDSLEPADTKGVDAISATPFGNRDNFGLRFDCTIQIDNAGDYTFYLHSDDGSRLLIDGDVVIDHDGVHGGTEKPSKVNLAAGRHSLRIDFFEAQGGEELRVTYTAADGQRLPIESLVVNSVDNELQAEPETELDANLIQAGQQLFVQRGCVACHQVDGVQVEAKGVPYENVNRGCLSETVSDSAVDFQLNDLQRTALQAALQAESTSTT
ncbi:MAG: c-type cytochrome, partial [Planctomycetales bacterium]|nr:c-type cytochrome [Planctomycetales bacterium]